MELTVQTNRTTAAPGDTLIFVATVQGQSLLGLDADFGDGATDSQAASGARTAKLTFRHVYRSRGAYTTRITATDGFIGQKAVDVGIQVF